MAEQSPVEIRRLRLRVGRDAVRALTDAALVSRITRQLPAHLDPVTAEAIATELRRALRSTTAGPGRGEVRS